MRYFIILLLLGVTLSCQENAQNNSTKKEIDLKLIKKYLLQYEPYEMIFDASAYSEVDKTILKKLIKASIYADTIFWLQTSKYGMHLRDSLELMKLDAKSRNLLALVKRNGGPFELLNGHRAFMGNQMWYSGGEIYPKGMNAIMFDSITSTLSPEDSALFFNPYTVIKADSLGGYRAVKFSKEYEKYIKPMSELLREVAELTDNASFATFLRLKATALETDDYYQADVSWIDMDVSKFDIVIGPYETYSDGIKGIKAKYEAYVEIVDQQGSADLKKYTSYLKEMEENLPIPKEYKSVVEGLTAKFVVVQDIIRTGEGAVGYQAIATNLPNDPEVHRTKGTKKTFWKNMLKARFNAIIVPVSERLIVTSQLEYLSDEGFFQVVLMHEICHAIGPRTVKVGEHAGMAINLAIGPNYNPLEETKADIVGLYSLAYLMDKGVVDRKRAPEFYVSFLGSLFRSIRFGLNEAHGKAAAISLNYLLAHGGINYVSSTNKWAINFDKFEPVIAQLAAELCILEGEGNNEKVQVFFDLWTKETPQLTKSLEATADIAIDIQPIKTISWD